MKKILLKRILDWAQSLPDVIIPEGLESDIKDAIEIEEDNLYLCYCGHPKSLHDSDMDERQEKFWCNGKNCDCGRFIRMNF